MKNNGIKKAFVICCNDSLNLVSLTKEGLDGKKEELAKEHYKKLAKNGILKIYSSQENISFKEYCLIYYWHIHEVELAE